MCEIIRQSKMNNPSKYLCWKISVSFLLLDRTLYLNESWELAERRWNKELREFKRANKGSDSNSFDISKIPDIYDNIKYDLEHNPELASEVKFAQV
jgi:hypothetical protein